MTLYILAGRKPVAESNLEKWSHWFSTADRIVAQTQVGVSTVSTVFLGLDHQWGTGPPLLFETMVFSGGSGGIHCRCSTWAEAEVQHGKIVAALEKAQNG